MGEIHLTETKDSQEQDDIKIKDMDKQRHLKNNTKSLRIITDVSCIDSVCTLGFISSTLGFLLKLGMHHIGIG